MFVPSVTRDFLCGFQLPADVVQLIKIKRVEQLVDPCSDSIGHLIINEPRARSVHRWLHGHVYGQRRHYLLRCLFDLFVFPIDLHTATVIKFYLLIHEIDAFAF